MDAGRQSEAVNFTCKENEPGNRSGKGKSSDRNGHVFGPDRRHFPLSVRRESLRHVSEAKREKAFCPAKIEDFLLKERVLSFFYGVRCRAELSAMLRQERKGASFRKGKIPLGHTA